MFTIIFALSLTWCLILYMCSIYSHQMDILITRKVDRRRKQTSKSRWELISCYYAFQIYNTVKVWNNPRFKIFQLGSWGVPSKLSFLRASQIDLIGFYLYIWWPLRASQIDLISHSFDSMCHDLKYLSHSTHITMIEFVSGFVSSSFIEMYLRPPSANEEARINDWIKVRQSGIRYYLSLGDQRIVDKHFIIRPKAEFEVRYPPRNGELIKHSNIKFICKLRVIQGLLAFCGLCSMCLNVSNFCKHKSIALFKTNVLILKVCISPASSIYYIIWVLLTSRVNCVVILHVSNY